MQKADLQYRFMLSLTVLAPLHKLQVGFMSQACARGDSGAVGAVNAASTAYVEMAFSHPRHGGLWENISALLAPDGDGASEGQLLQLRCEVVRCLAGLSVRLQMPLEEQPRKFFRWIQGLGSNDPAVTRPAVEGLWQWENCCSPHALQAAKAAVGTVEGHNAAAASAMAHAVQRTMSSTIKGTERDHAGNRKRASNSGPVRSWRRQVSQHVIAKSRARFISIPGGRDRLRRIGQMTWKQFQHRTTKVSSRPSVPGSHPSQRTPGDPASSVPKGLGGASSHALSVNSRKSHAWQRTPQVWHRRQRKVLAHQPEEHPVQRQILPHAAPREKA